jgi:MYXO-CTERM domain-containing protein
VIAIVTNAASSGESARPIVCLGDADEVEACLAPAMPDAGTSADAGADASALDPDAGPSTPAGGDCGCSAAGAPAGRGELGLFALAALVALRRRR